MLYLDCIHNQTLLHLCPLALRKSCAFILWDILYCGCKKTDIDICSPVQDSISMKTRVSGSYQGHLVTTDALIYQLHISSQNNEVANIIQLCQFLQFSFGRIHQSTSKKYAQMVFYDKCHLYIILQDVCFFIWNTLLSVGTEFQCILELVQLITDTVQTVTYWFPTYGSGLFLWMWRDVTWLTSEEKYTVKQTAATCLLYLLSFVYVRAPKWSH